MCSKLNTSTQNQWHSVLCGQMKHMLLLSAILGLSQNLRDVDWDMDRSWHLQGIMPESVTLGRQSQTPLGPS